MILLIEDDSQKGRRITEYVSEAIPHVIIKWVKSINEAISSLDDDVFEFVILDMSLPTFDEGRSIFSGGRQQNFGGVDVLAYMGAMNYMTPVVILTQFPDFEERGQLMTLGQLDDLLAKDFGLIYRGLVQYKNNEESWKSSLSEIIKGAK